MDKVKSTLELIRDKLNEFFRDTGTGTDGPLVLLSNLVEPDGAPYQEAEGKLVMFLANIQHETTISTYQRNRPIEGNKYAVVTPPLYIDLYVLFLANFYNRSSRHHQSYTQGLGVISRTISFFQQNPAFNHQNLPDLDPAIDKLTFEMTNLDVTDLNYLIGLAGVKYLPLVFYKVRMIPFTSDAMQAEVPAVEGLQAPGVIEEPRPDELEDDDG